jgi:hypothetical protein
VLEVEPLRDQLNLTVIFDVGAGPVDTRGKLIRTNRAGETPSDIRYRALNESTYLTDW